MQPATGEPLDYLVIFLFLAGILAFGSIFGRHTRTTDDFFFSGRRFAWWLIAFSCVATVVGSYSFIKYSAAAFSYGLSSTMTYLNDWFLAPLFMLGWVPLIYYSRVASIPEYFEKRFDRRTRVTGVVFIMLYMVGYIGINLYTLGVAMNAVVPRLGVLEWSAIIAAATAVYVTFGGQTAVIMTDLVQGILLLAAGLAVICLGIGYLGDNNPEGLSGAAAFWRGLPDAHRMPFSGFSSPDKFPMAGIFWQDLFGSSMFFYFANQGLIMRFLAAKSVHEGRKAAAAVILAMMPVAAVAVSGAGWVGRSMQSFGLLPGDTDPNLIFMVVLDLVARPGMFGLVLAALMGALMSTVDTLINAAAAIGVNDVWKPFVAPGRSDRHYLLVARVLSVLFSIAGLALVPTYMKFESIYLAHGSFTAAISPPIVVVVVLGILWKRFSGRAALLTLLAGGALMGASLKFPQLIRPLAALHGMDPGEGYHYMRALYGIILSSAIAAGGAALWPNRDPEKITGLWAGTLQAARRIFKGGEPNDVERGDKIKLTLDVDLPASEEDMEEEAAGPAAVISPEEAARMKARDGDMIYIADGRWWLGGLVSFHAVLRVGKAGRGVVRVSRRDARKARLMPGRTVAVEKIM